MKLPSLPGLARPTCARGVRLQGRVFSLWLILVAVGAQAATVPVETFFKPNEFRLAKLSPDGRKLAVITTIGGRTNYNLSVIDLQTKKASAVTGLRKANVSWFAWITNDRVVFRSVDEYGFTTTAGLQAVNIDGRKYRINLPWNRDWDYGRAPSGSYLGRSRAQQDAILIGVRNPRLPVGTGNQDVYRVDAYTLKKTRVAKNPGDVVRWVFDWNDVARAAVREVSDGNSVKRSFLYRDNAEEEWRVLGEYRLCEGEILPAGFQADNRILYVLSDIGRLNYALYTYDIETRKLDKLIFAHEDVDVGGVLYSHFEKDIIGIYYTAARSQVIYLEPGRASLAKALENNFKGYSARARFSDDGRSALIRTYSDRSPGAYYFYDKKTHSAKKVLEVASQIDPRDMADTLPISFKSRDGLTLHGYLTLPEQRKTPRPMIVLPHGGPFGIRDRWGFDREVQFLANRGYAVMQVNFRGSGGYGAAFEKAGWGQWGLKMQDDISDAVSWAVREGYADRDRICIFGASYGGYAAAMGLATTPEIYKCGIVYVGVTDLLKLTAQYNSGVMRRWAPGAGRWIKRAIGDRWGDRARLRATSPVHLADRIQAPVFIIHGKKDGRVPFAHATALRDALKSRGKSYEWLAKKNEGHGFYNFDNRVELYTKVENFLARYLQPAR